ncbi:DUF4333 domain-containing protein [Streptomyces albus]|nr:DUF4333 domain-containing protein [Streptomyces albus]
MGVLALTACSVEADSSSNAIGTGELEKQVDRSLTKQVGQAPKRVDCPDELESEKGAHTRCTLSTYDGLRFGVTVTVDKVMSDDQAHLDIKVDEKPQ